MQRTRCTLLATLNSRQTKNKAKHMLSQLIKDARTEQIGDQVEL
jgi:hypothetical protein